MDIPNGKDSVGVFGIVWRVLILVAFVIATFPPCFGAMVPGLDALMGIGLNEASNRHMVYGQDIVFTYGPLGFVLTPLDLGSNFVHVILFRLGLHVLWWISVGTSALPDSGVYGHASLCRRLVVERDPFGPLWDLNFQLTGVMILTTVGYLVLGHLDRRPIWAVPAVIVSAAAFWPSSISVWPVPARSWFGPSSNCSATGARGCSAAWACWP